MKCPKCNSEIFDKSKFCLECGSNISAISATSSVENKADISLTGLKTMTGASSIPLSAPVDMSIGDIRTVSGIKSGDGTIAIKVIKDRYELQEEIGRGGFAVVYKGLDNKLNRVIAVKVLSAQAGLDNATVERFQRESSIIASLNHRNILAVYDCDRTNEAGYFIVMEYIEGGTLRDYLKEKEKLELQDAVALMRGICKGMSYAHRKNLVHRDLKPANIMLTNDGDALVPKIVDFGLARSGGGSEVSISGYGMGTPFYMPPEQRRDAKSVNHTADIYALGKVFYEMLTGEIPDNVDTEKLPPECQMLNRIITKCVKSKPEERYFSVDELLAEIEKVMSSFGKESSIEKQPVTGLNVCPQCSTSNKPEAKFCAKCGTGLTRICSECRTEGSIHDKHCLVCGTDIESFQAAKVVLDNMEHYSTEKKWSRILKEASLLPGGISFSKEKGRKIISRVRELESKAKDMIEKEERLRERIQAELDKENYEPALKIASELLDDNPHEDDYKELFEEISSAHIEHKKGNVKELFEKMEYARALRIVDTILRQKPDDDESVRLKKEISGKIVEQNREKIRILVEKKDFEHAKEALVELLGGQSYEREYLELEKELLQTIAKQKKTNAKDLSDKKEYVKALWILDEVLKENPSDNECIKLKDEINKKIAELFRFRKMRTLRNRAMGVAVVVIIVMLIFAFIKYSRYRTFNSNCSQAQAAFAAKDFETAVKFCELTLNVQGYESDVTIKKLGEEARAMLERKTQFNNAMVEGKRLFNAKDWPAAEKAFTGAIATPGYENNSAACESLKKCRDMIVELRNSKNKAEYDKAVSAGKSALASKDHTKALNFFEIALKTPGYENDDTTIKLRDEANLKAILDGEIQRKKSEESWAESKKKISAFLSDLKNTSLNVASRIESVDSAIALFQKIADSSDAAYLSDSSKEEIATLKSLFISLKSTIVMYPPGFDMVKGSAADTKYWASEIRHKGTGIEMVYVVPGEFMMGSTVQEQDEAVRQGAKRAWVEGEVQHRVKLTKGYYIGKYEVTQGQYENVMGSNPSDFKSSGKEAPVETVNWGDCQAFCKKLGSGFRLPTEAEWEHAARGGNRSKGYIYSGSNNLDEVAWYDKNSGNKTQSVGQKKPNELGIFDMSGNVCEWCSDWYGDYSSGGVTDPAGASTGSTRVLRGGVWFGNVGYCRTADRRMYEPGNRNNLFGFRVVFPVR